MSRKPSALLLTAEQRQAIDKYEREVVLPSVTVSKAFQHLRLEKQASQTKLWDVRLFWMLRLDANRSLNNPNLLAAIKAAAERDDQPFFIELGELLKTPVLTDDDIKGSLTPLEKFLLLSWVRPGEYDRSLCYYSDPALLKFLNFILKKWTLQIHPALSPDTLEKAWRRLGLKKGRPLLFGSVEMRTGTILPVPFKKFRQKSRS